MNFKRHSPAKSFLSIYVCFVSSPLMLNGGGMVSGATLNSKSKLTRYGALNNLRKYNKSKNVPTNVHLFCGKNPQNVRSFFFGVVLLLRVICCFQLVDMVHLLLSVVAGPWRIPMYSPQLLLNINLFFCSQAKPY